MSEGDVQCTQTLKEKGIRSSVSGSGRFGLTLARTVLSPR